MVADNELLGAFKFQGIRSAPKGSVQIEVTFHIDSEGILNLTARDKETGQTVESTLKVGQSRAVKKGDKKREEEEALDGPPPLSLDMPTSSLFANAGQPPPEASRPRLPKLDPRATGLEASVPLGLHPNNTAPADLVPDAPPPPRVLNPPPGTPPAAGAELSPVAPPPAEAPGVFGRVIGWFKSLFGGK
jgi:hypothetical protein